MTKPEYDPIYPYVVNAGFGFPYARFHSREEAERAAEEIDMLVIDTTPKPKLSKDMEFIHWEAGEDGVYYANQYFKDEWWVTGEKSTSFYSSESLLLLIGDAEVTVLVRKDDA